MNKKPVTILSKYSYSPARSLKALVSLDLEIYGNITRILAPLTDGWKAIIDDRAEESTKTVLR